MDAIERELTQDVVTCLKHQLENPQPNHLGACLLVRGELSGSPHRYSAEMTILRFKHTLVRACRELHLYSGDDMYPISHPTLDGIDAYFSFDDMWSPDTEYGRRRRKVVALTIENLNELIAETA